MGLEGSEPYERLSRRPYEAASPRSPVMGLRSPGCQRSSRPSAGAPTPACGVGPVVGTEKSDDDTVASRLETIEAVVSITKLPSRCYPFVEDLAGLIRAVSGRWSPEPRQSAASAPRHLGVDQRDERLYIASAERLIGGANRVNSHFEKLIRDPVSRQVVVGGCRRPAERRTSPARELRLLSYRGGTSPPNGRVQEVPRMWLRGRKYALQQPHGVLIAQSFPSSRAAAGQDHCVPVVESGTSHVLPAR
jgi:hypothetical protein